MTCSVIYNLDSIVNIAAKYFNPTPEVIVEKKNQYAKNLNVEYVQTTTDFVPYNIQDLLNIFYTITFIILLIFIDISPYFLIFINFCISP